MHLLGDLVRACLMHSVTHASHAPLQQMDARCLPQRHAYQRVDTPCRGAGLGWGPAVCKFLEVLGIVWGLSQVTKLPRAAG